MFAFRETRESEVEGHAALDLAFTDRHLDLSLPAPDSHDDGLQRLAESFAPGESGVPVVGMRQVHGADVALVGRSDVGRQHVADALVTTSPGIVLLVRVADCVPVLLCDVEHQVAGVVHAGRGVLLAGVVPAALSAMRELGAGQITAWIGPHVCGRCYEVPESLREEVSAVVPQAFSTTSWGTAAVDVGAGVRAQLDAGGVRWHQSDRCTLEDDDLWSYRREGAAAGRLGGLIRIRG